MSKKLVIDTYPVNDPPTETSISEYRLLLRDSDSTGRERDIDLAIFYNFSTVKLLVEAFEKLGIEKDMIELGYLTKKG